MRIPSSWPEPARDALRYARNIDRGNIPAGELVQGAARRFLNDLERDDDFEFRFDPKLGSRVVDFVALCPHIKGPRAGEMIRCLPWQSFALCNLFGWVDEAGLRRFRQGFIFVPRKNGKTTLGAPVMLYLAFVEGEAGAEVYSAATTKDQARLSFDVAQHMVRRMPEFRERFGIEVMARELVQPASASVFKPLSADANTLDGLNVSAALLDELAQHRTAEVYDVIETGTGARAEPLTIAISTAGLMHSPGRTVWDYGRKVATGAVEDDRVFVLLYTIDKEDDVMDPEVWRKANPSWGESVHQAYFEGKANQAKHSAARLAAFKIKHLNVWGSSAEQLYSPRHWAHCAHGGLELRDFERQNAYLGLDLSSKTDLAALALLFPVAPDSDTARELFEPTALEGATRLFTAFTQSYLPEAAAEDGRNELYQKWADAGELIVTPGEITDFGRIKADVIDAIERFFPIEIGFDPWEAMQMASELVDEWRAPMVEVRPYRSHFAEPTDELDALMRTGRIRHDGNPVLAWAISNVVGEFDRAGNVFPTKTNPQLKIDPAVALIIALSRALRRAPESTPKIYGL